ncbi:hypothetical protein NSMM_190019 [Nitrosomonas mobilis]|uniref:Transposase DDE domain-containing protein n=1 Tax=Nitrosomonas mobilis TaxID=51642 RepID=A0A1G5SBG4_9PROT|nr:hypothetical protein NSMM_190019 [Nitrosomonas mobilis]
MKDSIPSQLRFPAFDGFSVRADFEGGALSSDFGAVQLRGVDKQRGLIARCRHDSGFPPCFLL